jgi:dihydroorotase
LLEGVSDGTIDFLSSDHAPHAPDEKEGGAAASGIAGVEWLLPVALRLLVDGQRVSWSRLVELTCERAAACFGLLSRGRIRAGNAADLAVVERCERMDDAVMTRASWNPYRELRPAWRVVATVVGGRLKWNGESVVDRTPGEEVLA